jgi:hypothetical protein
MISTEKTMNNAKRVPYRGTPFSGWRWFVSLAVAATGLAVIPGTQGAKAAPYDAICELVGTEQPSFTPLPKTGETATSTRIGAPYDVAVDTDGSVFYTTGGSGFVMKVSPSGVLTRFAGTGENAAPVEGAKASASPLDIPLRLSLDRVRRRLYVDGIRGITRIDLNTNIITRALGNGTFGPVTLGSAGPATPFRGTTGFDVAPNGDLVVAVPVGVSDNGTNIVRINGGNGIILGVAGTGVEQSLPVNGPTATTALPYAVDLTIDNSNNTYLLLEYGLIRIGSGTVTLLSAAPPGGNDGDGLLGTLRLVSNNTIAYDAATNSLFIAGGNAGTSLMTKVRRVSLSTPGLPTVNYSGRDEQGTGSIGDGLPRLDPGVHFLAVRGLAVAPDGALILADQGNNRIRRVGPGPTGTVSTIAGDAPIIGSGLGANPRNLVFGAPTVAAYGPDGTMYVSDVAARRVFKVATDGTTSVFAGDGGTKDIFTTTDQSDATSVSIGGPNAIAVAPDGNVYIAVNGEAASGLAYNVVQVDQGGKLLRWYGIGNGYFANSPDGSIARNVGTGYVTDLAVDSSGALYVAEYGTGLVRKIGADGILRTYANLNPGNDLTYSPTALAFDKLGNLFVGASSAVFRVDGRNGSVDRVVGTGAVAVGGATGFGGPASAATLDTVSGIALNAAGDLFVADAQTIMRVIPNNTGGGTGAASYSTGIITRIAGGAPGVEFGAGGPASTTYTRPTSLSVNPVTDALTYSEVSFGNGEYLLARQVREISSNGCASLRLSTSAASILATGNGTALADLPTSQLPRGGGIYALAKLRSADISNTALVKSPISSIPISSIPISSIPISSIPISSIPISSIGGWAALLVGTVFEGRPLQNVTLGQVRDLPNVRSIQLGQIDLRNSPLNSISIAAIALGSAPISSIPISSIDPAPPLSQWCAALALVGFDCVLNGVDSTTTLIDLELKAAPISSIPISSIPISSIPISSIPISSIPISSIPISSIPISSIPISSIKITGTPISSIPISSIPISSINLVVDCSLIDCATATFQDAFNAGAFRPGATLLDIVGALNTLTFGQLIPSLPASVTLEDILIGLVARADLPWEAASLEQIGLTSSGTVGGSVATYRANFRLFENRPAGPTTVAVTMPTGFTYRPTTGSVTFQRRGATLTSTPLEPTVSGQSLNFQLTGPAGPSDVSIEFELRTGTGTGTSRLDATVSPVTTNGTPVTESLTVSVVDPNEPNDVAPYPVIARDRLYIGAIGSATDRDNFTLPVPPRGTETEILLSHLPVDADLVVYDSNGEQTLRSGVLRPSQTGPLTQIVDPALGADEQNAEPQSLQDVPIDPALPFADASTRRGTATETVKLTSRGQGGNYTLQITGYNGASSGAPYLLRVRQTLPPGAGACPARSFAFAGQGTNGTASAIPANVRTVFLVNQKRLGDTYGAAAATSVMTRLNSLAARADVVGAILPVETNAAVAAAYSNWDSAPCDVTAPNAVVSAINNLVDATVPPGSAQRTSLQNIVVVGGDDIVPFARLDDDTSYSNELEYAGDVADGGAATPLSAAFAELKLLSDDPYGSFAPSRLSDGKYLYLPDVALGRLVETPSEMNGQIDQYLLPTVNGRLDGSSSLTTGYDFLTDGANGVNTALSPRLAAPAKSTLISDTWNKAALIAAMFPAGPSAQIVSFNGHFDHYGSLPAVADAAAGRADLLTTADLTGLPNRLVGRLVFSMGCHSGLSVPDSYLGANGSDRSLDWAQALARQRAVYVANTGFGYGDTDVVALSEKLNVEFAKRLDGTMTAGQALRFAKHAYAADGLTTVYDLKALHQFVYYGLPMFGVGPLPVTPPPVPPALPVVTDAATGLSAANVTVNPTFSTVAASNGSSYLTADGKSPLVADGRPIQPRTDVDITQPNGVVAHGALITALNSTDSTPFTVAIARPVVDLAAREPDVAANDAAFPSTLPNVTSFAALSGQRQRLSLAVGQWFADADPANATNIGTQRRFTSVSARVLYRPAADTDFTPPAISRVSGTSAGSSVTFQVAATDASGIRLVTVLYRDGAAWRPLTLTGSGSSWTGSGPASQTVVEFLIQVVDASGNVAVSSNKASLFVVEPGVPPTGRLKVIPSVCLKKERKNSITYRFGYDNPNPTLVRIERGNDNRLIGANKKLRRRFQPGLHREAFKVTVRKNVESVTWVLDGLEASATRNTAPCSDYSRSSEDTSSAADEREEQATAEPQEDED